MSELKRSHKLTDGKFSSALCECHTCDLESRCVYFRLASSERSSSPYTAVMYEQGAEIVPVSGKPDKCLAERKISQLEQLDGTLFAKDSLFLQLGDDV